MSTVAAPAPVRRPSPWIEGAAADLLLYVATPLLIAPIVLLAVDRSTPEIVYLWVASLGALGHHLPGMMRAYGDRALYRRFRTRFVVAPIFLVLVCCAASVVNRPALLLVVFFWGVWHGLMQSHGMARIYDAKVGCHDARTARLDHLLIFSWFGAGVFFSQSRWSYVLEVFYGAGGAVVSAGVVRGVQVAWGALTAVATLAFLANLAWGWRHGRRQSPVKLLLHATTITYWMALNLLVPHLLVSLVLFEIFHDVQYLSIVWRFNRGRVEKDPEVGSFSRFLFRRSWAMLGLYVGLVFAYGSLNLAHQTWLGQSQVGHVLAGVLTASALLHFYYDGFIWKMRERATRETLGVVGDAEAGRQRPRMPPAAAHALKWALFVVPLAVLCVAGRSHAVTSVEALDSIAAVAPDSKLALHNLGLAQRDAGDLAGARETLERARALPAYDGRVDHGVDVTLAWTLVDLATRDLEEGRPDEARPWLAEARAINPDLADAVVLQASDEATRGQLQAAELHGRVALALAPEHRAAHYVLAQVLRLAGRTQDALFHARELARLSPGDERAARLVADLGG